MNLKKIFILSMLVLLLLGISYATEVSNDTESTTDTNTISTTKEVVHNSNTPTKVDKTLTDKKNKDHDKTIKTASETYNISDSYELTNVLTNYEYNELTVNIKSNLTLTDSTQLNEAITTLTINGNGNTINGYYDYQFLNIPSESKVKINNLIIKNCLEEYGGSIYNTGELTLTNLTLTGNNADMGGAIYNSGKLTIINCTLKNNEAPTSYYDEGNGGAIYNSGELEIYNSTLTGNTATEGGAISNNGKLSITNSNLTGNYALSDYDNFGSGDGGAIYNGEELTIHNSTLNNNKAAEGGAIYTTGNLYLTGTTLIGNYAQGENEYEENGRAGAIYNGGELTIHNSTLNNNKAADGGAIYNNDKLNITCTILNNNKATGTDYDSYYEEGRGGAIYNYNELIINNSTLNNNTANYGGAVYNYENSNIINSTLNNNTANYYSYEYEYEEYYDINGYGGAIYNRKNLNITNSNLNHNNATTGGAIYSTGDVLNVKNNKFIINHGYKTIYCQNGNITNNIIKNILIIEDTIVTVKNNNTVIISGSIITENKDDVPDIKIDVKLNDKTVINQQEIKDGNLILNFTTPNNYGVYNVTLAIPDTQYYVGIEKSIKLQLPTTIYVSSNGIGDGTTINNPANMTYALKMINDDYRIVLVSNKASDTHNYDINIDSNLLSKGITKLTIEGQTGKEITIKGKITVPGITLNLNNIIFDGQNKNNAITASCDANLTITNCIFKNHNQTDGGAIYNSGTLNINNCTFNNNKAKDNGGAIYNSGTLNINHCTFNNNKADYGGAIYNNEKLTISNTILTNNIATESGGAIYNNEKLTISNTILTDNYASEYGGAIYTSGSITNINNNTFNNNKADYGGAFYSLGSGNISINKNIFTDNYANQEGSAICDRVISFLIYNYSSNGLVSSVTKVIVCSNLIVNNNTFMENKAYNGEAAAIILDESSTVSNNIFYPNSKYNSTIYAQTYNGNITNNIFRNKIINTTITINKITTTEYADDVVIRGTLKTTSGKPVNSTTITVYINGKKYTVKTSDNGIFTVSHKANTLGTNSVTATFSGNIEYANSTSKTTFNVISKPTKITLNKVTNTQYTDYATITGSLKTSNDQKLGQYTLTFNVNGAKVATTKTDTNGTFTYKYKTNTIGTNNITVTFAGTKEYKTANSKTTFNVTPKATKITINKISNTKYANNATIKGTFKTNSGTPLKSTTLTVQINGKKVGTTKTDTNGTFTYKYKTNKVGKNNITISYAGNNKYKTTSTKSTFNVTKQNLKITVNNIKVTGYGSNVTISGKFMDATGKLLGNSIIRINLNGKTYKVKANPNGVFKKSIKTNKLGTNNVTISYPGNKNYNSISVKKTFKVVKNNVTVTITSAKQVGKTRNIRITGKFTDKSGNILQNSQVTVKINNKTYYAKTNSKGIYTITKVAKKGVNTITVGYAGNKNYNKFTSTVRKVTIA
ncbi:MAG: hypothetical protein BZ138_07590 [Methanosphaera sp. rholeuAM270]|nr:MAG: hypothetical protein BZ138_07590 [Methanosphaera sp. rholeuAM270]